VIKVRNNIGMEPLETIRAIGVTGARPLSVSNSHESIRHVLRNTRDRISTGLVRGVASAI